MFLLDTNIISEVRKGERCDRRVAHWYASIEDSDLFLSVLVLGEIRRGVELARRNDSAKADALGKWLQLVEETFGPRILPVDAAVEPRFHALGKTNDGRRLHISFTLRDGGQFIESARKPLTSVRGGIASEA